MPMQTLPSSDDAIMERDAVASYKASAAAADMDDDQPGAVQHDPENEDDVMLFRRRVSRILFDDKFYDYPISLSKDTFVNMGFVNTIKVGFSYIISI